MKYQKIATAEHAMKRRGEPHGDIRLLTDTQAKVHLLDCQGLTPTQIAERAGLSLSRVANIKCRLRQLGFNPLKFRRKPEEMPNREEPVLDTPVPRSELEPEDDELPDLDEPAMAVDRCHCGLIKPCYHAPVSVWVNQPGYRSDIVSHSSGHHYEVASATK